MSTSTTSNTHQEATIEAHPTLPIISITREFRATPAQLKRAYTDPELFVRWVGPTDITTTIDRWDASRGGGYRYVSVQGAEEYGFFGSFHDITDTRIVQTFTWEGMPEAVALETLWLEDLGDGRTRVRTQSLFDSLEGRDRMLRSGMDVGVNDGFAKLDDLLATGEL